MYVHISTYSIILRVMETIPERLQGMLSEAWTQAYQKVYEILPEAALAVLIIAVGLFFSAALYFLAVKVMEFFAIDKLAGKTPLQRMLHNIGIHKNISHILALLIFWLGILITLIFAADILNLEQVSNALAVVTRFIPQVIAALLIVIFGMLLAKFLQVFVEQTVGKANMSIAATAGKVVYIAVLVFVLHLVVVQLGFDLSFVTTNVIIIFASLLFIGGIATAFATRTLLESAVACFQLKRLLKVGQEVSIQNTQGRIKQFTLTSVVMDSGGAEVVLPAILFFTETYTLKGSPPHGE